MTKTSLKSHRSRCRDRLLKGTPVAFVLTLLLAACQGSGPPDTLAPGKNADQLMHVADDTRAGGDLGTAVDLYRRAAEINPQDPRPILALGATLTQLHAYTEAAATYRAGLKIQPNKLEGDLRRGLAIVLLSINQPEEAIAELSTGIANAPEDARLYSTLGVAHDLFGRHDLAQQDYRNGIRLAPKNQGLRNNYGLSLALSGDYPAAAVTLSELADDPNASPRHRLNLALVYGLAGDDNKAAAIARTALDESAVKSNLAYYAMLRGMDDRGRANAIMGGQLRGTTAGTVVVAEPTPPRADGDDQTHAAAAGPAPRTPVMSKPLAQSPNAAEPAQVAESSAPPVTPETMSSAEPAVAETAAAPGETADDKAMAAPTRLANAEPPASEPQSLPAEASAPAPAPSQETAAAEPAKEPSAAPSMEKSESAPPAMAAAKHGAKVVGFAVQAGSFANEANAHKLADQLNHKGYDVAVVHHKDHEGRDWFAVRAGGYGSEDEAAAAARHMRDSEQLPAVVVHQRGSSQA